MVDGITIVLSILGAILGAFFGPYFTHSLNVKYFKKEYIFREKISLFEKLGAISWKNHLILTTIENTNTLRQMNEQKKALFNSQLQENVTNFSMLMDKLIYFSDGLRKNMGKYISLFERYLNDSHFGEIKTTKKLREDYRPFLRAANKIMEKELQGIK